MREQVEARLERLQQEQQAIQKDLGDLEQMRQGYLQRLLALQGGIQVLQELLGACEDLEPQHAWEPLVP